MSPDARLIGLCLAIFVLLAPHAVNADQPLGLKPWITTAPGPNTMSRITQGLDLKPRPRAPSRGASPVDTDTTPRSASAGRLTMSNRHRAQQYRARLLGEVRRYEARGGADTRRRFDQLQSARRELFRIERELAR